MKLIVPNAIDLVSSSLTETEYSAWSSATAYAVGGRCIYAHYIYECLVANTNKRPDQNLTGAAASWRKIGATNMWAMFDETASTQSVAPSGTDTLVVEVAFDYATGLGLINVDASALKIEVFDSGETTAYYTRELSLVNDTSDFFEYFYSPIEHVDDVTFNLSDVVAAHIPVGIDSTLRITLTKSGGGAACGHLVVGYVKDIGQTQWNAKPSTRNFSSVTEDDFGNTTIVKRRVAKKVSCTVNVPPQFTDSVFKTMAKIDATPALFLADNRDTFQGGYECLVLYGLKKTDEFDISGPGMNYLNIDIDGLA